MLACVVFSCIFQLSASFRWAGALADVQDGGLPHGGRLRLDGERGVPGHEEVAPRRGDQRRHEADEVVVHVPRVA